MNNVQLQQLQTEEATRIRLNQTVNKLEHQVQNLTSVSNFTQEVNIYTILSENAAQPTCQDRGIKKESVLSNGLNCKSPRYWYVTRCNNFWLDGLVTWSDSV